VGGDTYLRDLLMQHQVNAVGAQAAGNLLFPTLQRWGGSHLVKAEFSGSLAKGTAVSLSTDADIFLSLSSSTPGTLAEMYSSLFSAVRAAGLQARQQNVSIGTVVNGYSIDLVPGRRQSQFGNGHSLFRSKANSWTLTNITTQINLVAGSGRSEEIRVLKIWRTRHGLEMPSFYLELATLDALHNASVGDLAANVWRVLQHLRDNIQRARYVDPANTNNVISDDCTPSEKAAIAAKARQSLLKKTWSEVVW